MVCERSTAEAFASWKDGCGDRYILQERTEADAPLRPQAVPHGEDLPEDLIIHQAGTSSAVWMLGGAVCKVKSWAPGLQLEHETIDFVNRHFPDIPTTKVIHAWIDRPLNRMFTLFEHVKGDRLDRAWSSLSEPRRRSIAVQVAALCATLASQTSTKFQTVSGCGSTELFLIPKAPEDHPSWKPLIWDPQTVEEATRYFSPIEVGIDFVFYHADLGPTNIFIGQNGAIEAIIDWEAAAFYPSFYVATKPLISYGFVLEDHHDEIWAWAKLLASQLERQGFKSKGEEYRTWRACQY